MTIAQVGSRGSVTEITNNTSLTLTFGQATTSGNFLVAFLAANNNGASDPFGSSATGWAKVVTSGGANQWVSIWAKPNCGASESNPAFTTATSSGGFFGQLVEFSGVATTTPNDQNGTLTGSFATQAPQCSASDTGGSELCVAVVAWNGSNTAGTIGSQTFTDSNGSSFTVNSANGLPGSETTYYYDFAWGATGSVTGANKDKYSTALSVFSSGSAAIASFLGSGSVVAAQPPGPAAIPIWV